MQYAEYIWGCYFLTAGFMGLQIWLAYYDHQRLFQRHDQ
ncbi:MAG: hypothetical protein RLZ35_1052 [Pseudomonadota bacterium]|jgi:heme exporter protein CcmD